MRSILAALLAILVVSPAWGQLSEKLFITEVMWDSSHPGTDGFNNGGHANGDWWELLNVSDEAIDLTGFMWDDDDRLFGNDFTIFPEVVLQPNELLIVLREEEVSVDHEDGFRYAWDIPAGVKIINENLTSGTGSGDPFSGLAADGDEVNFYDAEGNLIQSIELESATTGLSRSWGFVDGAYTELGLSDIGENSAVEARSDGSEERLTDPNYDPLDLDVSSAGRVVGIDVFIPSTEVDLDALCAAVAAGTATPEQMESAMAAAGVIAGDADQNGSVEFSDFLTLSGNFGEAGTFSGGDFNCSGTVDFPDFLMLSTNFGLSAGGAQAVPEPASLPFWFLAAWGLVSCRRRR